MRLTKRNPEIYAAVEQNAHCQDTIGSWVKTVGADAAINAVAKNAHLVGFPTQQLGPPEGVRIM